MLFRNAEYNSSIAAGETVSIGIKGVGGTAEDEPDNYMLYAYEDVVGGDGSDDISSEDGSDGMQSDLRDWGEMQDTDGDGLPDEYEGDIGTDINNPDTDGDSLL